MLVTIRTLNTQRKITVNTPQELDTKIKELYKTDSYQLFSDPDRTVSLRLEDIKDQTTAFMSYEMGEVKEYKPHPNCKHGPEAVCPQCVDLEKTERALEPDKKARYLSYQSYRQTLENNSMKEETHDYEIRVCEDHPPSQKCSRCMEKRVTLLGQVYRQMDYVEFDSRAIMENFINHFKSSGRQKVGLLIGKYDDYGEVPMGRKAVVSGIWEFEQECFPDGVVVEDIPGKFFTPDLQIVGVIYTDLIFAGGEITSAKKIGKFLISTIELSFINYVKEKVGNEALTGVCISANENGELTPEIFMVTEQFSALSRAGALGLTTDPTKFRANREIVYYVLDEYKNRVAHVADPYLPVYYFFVKCECGFKEHPLFAHDIEIKNPTLKKLSGHFCGDFQIEKFRNFSILMDLEKYIPGILGRVIEAVLRGDQTLLDEAVRSMEFEKFKKELDRFDVRSWSCGACTYLNPAFNGACEMCGEGKVKSSE